MHETLRTTLMKGLQAKMFFERIEIAVVVASSRFAR